MHVTERVVDVGSDVEEEERLEPQPVDRLLVPSVIVTIVLVTAVRWAFSSDRRVFHVSPDEASQVAVARWLAGGRWNMFDHATWQPGLGTLLTPVFWFTDDGSSVVQAALAVNALIAGLAAAVLVLLTRRLCGLGPVTCAALATAVAVAPSSLSASAFVWAEPLVSLTFLGTVVMLLRWFETDRITAGIGAVAVAVAGYTSHSRLLVLVATTVAMTVGAALLRRRWAHAAVLGLAATALMGASLGWTRWLLANIWDDPSDQNTVGSVWERAQEPLKVADALLGQVWYQGAATVGTAFVGTAILARAAMTRRHTARHVDVDVGADAARAVDRPAPHSDRRATPLPADARVVLGSVLPLIGLSAVFMSDRPRADQFIYGRYNDAIVWPLITVGLAWLVDRATGGLARKNLASAALVLVGVLGTGLAVDAMHGDAIREDYGVRSMIAGLLPHVDDTDTLDVWRASIWAAAIFTVLVGVAALAGGRRVPTGARRMVAAAGVLGFAGLLVVAGVRTERVADIRLNGWERTNAVRIVDELVPEGVALGVHPVPDAQDPAVGWVPQRQRFQLYQLWLPDRVFLRDRGLDDDVGPYVFAPLDDPDLVDAGAELLWRDPGIKVGLWKEPAPG